MPAPKLTRADGRCLQVPLVSCWACNGWSETRPSPVFWGRKLHSRRLMCAQVTPHWPTCSVRTDHPPAQNGMSRHSQVPARDRWRAGLRDEQSRDPHHRERHVQVVAGTQARNGSTHGSSSLLRRPSPRYARRSRSCKPFRSLSLLAAFSASAPPRRLASMKSTRPPANVTRSTVRSGMAQPAGGATSPTRPRRGPLICAVLHQLVKAAVR